MAQILVVDDEPHICWIFSRVLEGEGHAVRSAGSGKAALEAAAAGEPDLVFLDFKLPDMNGLELLRALRGEGVSAPVIMITAYESVKDAVLAIKEGAFDYLSKPLNNDEILYHARRALELNRLRRQVREYGSTISRLLAGDELVGSGPEMGKVLDLVRLVAPSDMNVLITGESGTGKELVARKIHLQSGRRDGPFVVVDCGALPETLVESEVFGHEKGAFTGAAARTIGKFEAAAGGTLFLDEISNASPGLQAKLLRAIETKSFSRVGGHAVVHADVRVVAASNQDLALRSAKGDFRSDLYYRLKGVEIALPPLRERPDDLPELIGYFVRRFAGQQHRAAAPRVTAEAVAVLKAYPWPGNVRELKNLLERSVLICGDAITPEHFPPEVAGPRRTEPPPLPAVGFPDPSLRSIREITQSETEKRALQEALARCRGNKRAAARQLQVDPKTLYRLLRKYGLDQPSPPLHGCGDGSTLPAEEEG